MRSDSRGCILKSGFVYEHKAGLTLQPPPFELKISPVYPLKTYLRVPKSELQAACLLQGNVFQYLVIQGVSDSRTTIAMQFHFGK